MSDMNAESISREFVDLLRRNAVEAGKELASDIDSVRVYAAERLTHLSRIVGEPGFEEALAAERDAVALRAAGHAINRADAFDARILGVVEGTLALGARVLGGSPSTA